jgi:fructuronate reductase
VPGRLLQGFAARMAADAGPIAVVPCDNLLDNGPTVASVVLSMAHAVSSELAGWIEANVSFVSTTVDRITPATTPADVAVVEELTGFSDQAPVVTEPFTEWVLAGSFPAGRPAWEAGGARFVDDVTPFEQRKLWLLNGSHSLLAYAAPLRGHATVAEAIADPVCREWVETWFELASTFLPFATTDLLPYRASLVERYENPRIRHNLSQIAMDGSQKLPIRVLPVVRQARAAGVRPLAGAVALAGWVAHLRKGLDVRDPRASELIRLAQTDDETAVRSLLGVLDAPLAEDKELVGLVVETFGELTR